MKKMFALAILVAVSFSFAGSTPTPVINPGKTITVPTIPADIQAKIDSLKGVWEAQLPADMKAKLDAMKASAADWAAKMEAAKKDQTVDCKALIEKAMADANKCVSDAIAKLPADQKAQVEKAVADMQKRIDEAVKQLK